MAPVTPLFLQTPQILAFKIKNGKKTNCRRQVEQQKENEEEDKDKEQDTASQPPAPQTLNPQPPSYNHYYNDYSTHDYEDRTPTGR